MDRLVSRQRWSRSKEKQRCLKRTRSLILTYGVSVPDEWWEPESWDAIQKHLPAPLAAQVGYWRGLAIEIQKGLDALTKELRQAWERRVIEPFLADAKNPLHLAYAIPDHPWIDSADDAAVRIAMTVAAPGKAKGILEKVTDERPMEHGEVEVSLSR